ncbi:DUF5684 domain-containing protein [Planctopirus hydrillae]|nr:DUF5684 domain-containing protein [Planctopirus hydrillae]
MFNLDFTLLAGADIVVQQAIGELVRAGFLSCIGCFFTFMLISGMWMVFKKAGHPGWVALIPFYNLGLLFEIAGWPFWWMFAMIIPGVNLFVYLAVAIDLAKSFGKHATFAVGLALFPFVGIYVLGLGEEKYLGHPYRHQT